MQLGWIWYHQKRLEILIPMIQESSVSFKIEKLFKIFQFDGQTIVPVQLFMASIWTCLYRNYSYLEITELKLEMELFSIVIQ